MKYLDEYRDPHAARRLLAEIREVTSQPWVIMEVCGGQTHSLLRYGIEEELRGAIELMHGPGCPVCVTPIELIDYAQQLAMRPQTLVASFGDMLRVPGTRQTLLEAKAQGGSIQTVYSPMDAVQLAKESPETEVVFFAVGFETTAPATALAAQTARQLGVDNFSLLVAHVRVQPAMEMLAADPNRRLHGFLAAGHVCTVMGYESYEGFVEQFSLPVVVTGFEPLDLLSGILACVKQLESGRPRVENQYGRSVQQHGNQAAKDIVCEVYEICDRSWRGFGTIAQGGLQLRPEWRSLDAEHRFKLTPQPAPDGLPIAAVTGADSFDCPAGDVLAGRIKPTDCAAFGKACTPESPLGAPMVSSEGACAAYYRYHAKQHSS